MADLFGLEAGLFIHCSIWVSESGQRLATEWRDLSGYRHTYLEAAASVASGTPRAGGRSRFSGRGPPAHGIACHAGLATGVAAGELFAAMNSIRLHAADA